VEIFIPETVDNCYVGLENLVFSRRFSTDLVQEAFAWIKVATMMPNSQHSIRQEACTIMTTPQHKKDSYGKPGHQLRSRDPKVKTWGLYEDIVRMGTSIRLFCVCFVLACENVLLEGSSDVAALVCDNAFLEIQASRALP
jgi:hypothetical protein